MRLRANLRSKIGARLGLRMFAVLVRRPTCLRADEPFRGITPKDAEELTAVFPELARDGVAVVLTGQDAIAARVSVVLAQYVARLHRECDGKREVVVYDYVDSCVPVLARMATRRQAGCRALGYSPA